MMLAHLALWATLLSGKPAQPAPTDPLRDCEVFGPAFGLDRTLLCKTFTIDVFPAMPAAKAPAAMVEFSRTLAAEGDAKQMLSSSDISVAGRTRNALRYMKRRSEDGASDNGLITTVPAGKDGVRLVRCWQGLESGCVEVFTHLARGLPEPTAAAKATTPRVAGRPLALEAGCTYRPPGQLTCAGSELTWLELYPRAPDTLAAVEQRLHNALWIHGRLEARDRYCSIEGTDALCRELTVTPPRGPKLRVLYGFTTARGARLYAACSTRADPAAALPAPCAQVMALKAP